MRPVVRVRLGETKTLVSLPSSGERGLTLGLEMLGQIQLTWMSWNQKESVEVTGNEARSRLLF